MKTTLAAAGLLLTSTLLSGCNTAIFTGATETGNAMAEERTLGGVVDDKSISAQIHHHIIQSDVNALLTDIDIRVYEGRVMLTGLTPDGKVAEEAVRLCWLVEGVREVINAVKVGEKRTVSEYSYDNLIESEIEARLLATKNIKSINFTVEVVTGTAYILGTAQDETERHRVEKVTRYIKGVKKVESYIRLRNDPRRPFMPPEELPPQKKSK